VASPLTARDRGRPGTSPASPCPTERTRVVAKKIGPMSSRRFASPSGPARPTDTATGRLGAVRPRRTRSNPPRARDSPTSDLHSSETSCLSLHQPECCCGRDPGVGGHAIGVGAAPTALLRDIDRPGWVQTGDLSRVRRGVPPKSARLRSPEDAPKCLLIATCGDDEDGRGGFRTCDLSRVKHGVRCLIRHRNACKSGQMAEPTGASRWA
jgi:hypothetical protein